MEVNKQRRSYILLSVLLYIALLSGCGDPSLSSLIPAGPVADVQLSLMKLSLGIMSFVMAVVFALFGYVVIRFRQRPGDTHIPEQVSGNTLLEIIWTTIPIILIIILAVPTLIVTFDRGSGFPESEGEAVAQQMEEEAGLRINVEGHLFWWEVEYPDQGIVTAQEIYIPTNEQVFFELTASQVIHSFWVPPLAGKKDTVPGITNELWLAADEPGVYEGRCAELCGSSHALMNFRVVALEPDEFEQWVESMTTFNPEVTDTELAAEGRDLFNQSCIGCHAVESDIANSQGPNLAGFANRSFLAGYMDNNEENLADWIKSPGDLKPAAYMPTAEELGLSDEDIAALVEYLSNLTRQDEQDLLEPDDQEQIINEALD